MRNKVLYIVVAFSLVLSMAMPFVANKNTKALSSSDFNAGRIIDDVVFRNKNSMSVQQIQDFLNAKVPTCDRNHTGFTGSSGTVYSPPWTCLKEYNENTSTLQNNIGQFNTDGSPYQVPGGISAAQIIWNAGQQYNINPQVILATLQKESGIVTDTWAAGWQYKTAMGYGCPDTGPNNSANCSANYFGFYNQVNDAAWQFNQYIINPSSYNFQSGVTRYIQYSPDVNCGGSDVAIQTAATAALYNYTPYQPNPAALAGMSNISPGNSVNCGAYGNRNFFWYFNLFFGSTYVINPSVTLSSPLTINNPKNNYYTGDTITASYSVKNNAIYSINAGGLGICARINGTNVDLGYSLSNTIPGGSTISISYSLKIAVAGNLTIFTCSQLPDGTWSSDTYPYDSTGSLARKINLTTLNNPQLTSGLTVTGFSGNTAVTGQNITASFTLYNAANVPINIGSMVVAARDQNGNNFDFPLVNDVIVPANGTYTYSNTKNFAGTGSYNLFIANWNQVWSTQIPYSSNSSIVRSLNLQIQNYPTISSSLTTVKSGQAVTATFSLRNPLGVPINLGSMVVAARDQNGNNFDFPLVNDVIVPANGTYTYSNTKNFAGTGSYNLFIANWNQVWSTQIPYSSNSSIVRSLNLQI